MEFKGKASIQDEDGNWHEFTDEQIFELDYSKLSKNSQKELDKILERIDMPTNTFILESTPGNKYGFFNKLWRDEPKYATYVSPSIRPNDTFVCDVFKDGNYYKAWMNQEEINLARSTGFTVTIDPKDPLMYDDGWKGLYLANLDSCEFNDEYCNRFLINDKNVFGDEK